MRSLTWPCLRVLLLLAVAGLGMLAIAGCGGGSAGNGADVVVGSGDEPAVDTASMLPLAADDCEQFTLMPVDPSPHVARLDGLMAADGSCVALIVALPDDKGTLSTSAPFLCEVGFDARHWHVSAFEWAESIAGDRQVLTLVLDDYCGRCQIGACPKGSYARPLPATLGALLLAKGPNREVASLDPLECARSRIPDLETVYLQEYDPDTGTAGLDQVLLTWSYALTGDTNINTEVEVGDLTEIGQRYGAEADYDCAFLPSTELTFTVATDPANPASVFQGASFRADANHNGIVDYMDLTPIGINFGLTLQRLTGRYIMTDGETEYFTDLEFSKDGVAAVDEILIQNADAEAKDSPTATPFARNQYCRRVEVTQGLVDSITGNLQAKHGFALVSHYKYKDPHTSEYSFSNMESLRRASPYHGVSDTVSISRATLPASVGTGLVAPLVLGSQSYVIVASAEGASSLNHLEAFEYDRQSIPPAIEATSSYSYDIPSLASITDLQSGEFGFEANLVVLGTIPASAESRVVFLSLGSEGFELIDQFDVGFEAAILIAGCICGFTRDEVLLCPGVDSLHYQGLLIAYDEGFTAAPFPLGEGVTSGTATNFIYTGGPLDSYPDHLFVLTAKNGVQGDLALIQHINPEVCELGDVFDLPSSSAAPIGGLLADYGRSLGDLRSGVDWDLREMTAHSFVTTGMQFPIGGGDLGATTVIGFRDLPYFSYQLCRAGTGGGHVAFLEDDFCMDIYRNVLSPSGDLVDTEIRGVQFCSLRSEDDRDLAYITHDAVGWRIGSETRFLWSETYSPSPGYIATQNPVGGYEKDRLSTFGPIYLLGAEDEIVFSPAHMACAPLGGAYDKDDIVVSASVGLGGRHLLVISFE